MTFDNYTAVSQQSGLGYSPYIEFYLEYKPNTQLPDNASETFTIYSLDNASDNMSAKATYNAEDGSFLINMWHYEKLSGDRWQLKDQNGNIIGEFNFSILSTTNNLPGFILYIKINEDDNGDMSSMDIRWYTNEGNTEKPVGQECLDPLADNLTITYGSDFSFDYRFTLQSVIDNGTTFVYTPDADHVFNLTPEYNDDFNFYNFLIQYYTGPAKYYMYVGGCNGGSL